MAGIDLITGAPLSVWYEGRSGRDTAMGSEMEPIEWPDGWTGFGQKRRFLEGMPFAGVHSQVIRKAKSILRGRDEYAACSLWQGCPTMVTALESRERVFVIASCYLNWPNHRFIPTDRAAIVLGFIPGIWIDPDDVLADIAKEFRLGRNRSDLLCLHESACRDRLVEFLGLILA